MSMIFSLTPGLVFIAGGIISFLTRGIIQKFVALATPILAFLVVSNLNCPIHFHFLFNSAIAIVKG